MAEQCLLCERVRGTTDHWVRGCECSTDDLHEELGRMAARIRVLAGEEKGNNVARSSEQEMRERAERRLRGEEKSDAG